MNLPVDLPEVDRAGDIDDWVLPGKEGDIAFTGYFLGVASSRKQHHRLHYGRDFAGPNEKCGACRWFEPRVFREVKPKREDVVLGTVGDVHPDAAAELGLTGAESNMKIISKHLVGVPGRFLVHRTGRTIVPGEVDLVSYEWVSGATELIDALSTRPVDDEPYLSNPAADLLEKAILYDAELRAAYQRMVES